MDGIRAYLGSAGPGAGDGRGCRANGADLGATVRAIAEVVRWLLVSRPP